jgi:cell division protein FtsI (penicillin-binding protein 3)
MGSTFKVLNTAIALESGAATTNQRFEVSKPLRVSRFTITDYHPHNKPLNVPEILVYSSNIGSALMAEAVGAKTQRAYMNKLGLLDRLELEIPEVSRPLSPKQWHRTTTVTVSYGHGISISPAHLASAVAAASGTGQWIQPTLMKRRSDDTPLRLRIFSEETTRAVRSMMRLVVSHADGTGNFAEARGYMVGGKTGTAEKIQAGNYNKKANLATFVAIFPAHEPRYVIVILVDEPKGQKHSFGYSTAGWVVAPAVRRIVEQIAPILGVLPVDEKSPLIRQKMLLDFTIGDKEATLASY